MKSLEAVVCFENSSKFEGEVVGFVVYTPKTNAFDTVPESSTLKKKVVVLHPDLKGEVKAGKRYSVSMIPMRSNKGYVAVTAEPEVLPKILGRVTKSTIVKKVCYEFDVYMGAKKINVNLMSGKKEEACLKTILSIVKCEGLENEDRIISYIKQSYRELVAAMTADGMVLVVDGKVIN